MNSSARDFEDVPYCEWEDKNDQLVVFPEKGQAVAEVNLDNADFKDAGRSFKDKVRKRFFLLKRRIKSK